MSKKADLYLQHTSSKLCFIFNKAKELAETERQLGPLIKKHVGPDCQIANVAEGQLTLLVPTAAVAMQVRYHTAALLQTINNAFPSLLCLNIERIRCKVRPTTQTRPTEKERKMQLLSNETAKFVLDVAQTIKDAKLRGAMERIAKHTKDGPTTKQDCL